ncbi:MAG: BrnT family toxin [Deltaproteobacteria bacterium]|nr:BrnT family toxin [Deltaproteobacteria bacterium]
MTILGDLQVRISDFEWDEGNALHLELGHGITTEEAEEVFLDSPLFRRTRKGHYAAFGSTGAGRYLTIIFEVKAKSLVRIITGWDMKPAEIRYYKKQRGK